MKLSPPGGRTSLGIVPVGASSSRGRRRRASCALRISQAPKLISRRPRAWGRRGRAALDRIGRGARARPGRRRPPGPRGRKASSRASAAVSERSAGTSDQPTISFGWVGPWRTHQIVGHRVPSGSVPFSTSGSPAIDLHHQPGARRQPLVEPALGRAEPARQRVVGHDPRADLVRHHDDRGRRRRLMRVQQPAFLGGQVGARPAIWFDSHSVAQSISTASSGADRGKRRRRGRAAPRPWSSPSRAGPGGRRSSPAFPRRAPRPWRCRSSAGRSPRPGVRQRPICRRRRPPSTRVRCGRIGSHGLGVAPPRDRGEALAVGRAATPDWDDATDRRRPLPARCAIVAALALRRSPPGRWRGLAPTSTCSARFTTIPAHHRVQAEAVADLAPAALVFEMLTAGAGRAGHRRRCATIAAALAEALDWAGVGLARFRDVLPDLRRRAGGARSTAPRCRARTRGTAMQIGVPRAFGAGAERYGLAHDARHRATGRSAEPADGRTLRRAAARPAARHGRSAAPARRGAGARRADRALTRPAARSRSSPATATPARIGACRATSRGWRRR